MIRLNPYEERIIRVLLKARRRLTTSQVSRFSGISHATAKSYLEKLKNWGFVTCKKSGNRTYWEAEE